MRDDGAEEGEGREGGTYVCLVVLFLQYVKLLPPITG